MSATRRQFLRKLFTGAAAVAAAPVLAKVTLPPAIASAKVAEGCACTIAPAAPAQLTAHWFQTTRLVSHCSPAYLAALDRIMEGKAFNMEQLYGKA